MFSMSEGRPQGKLGSATAFVKASFPGNVFLEIINELFLNPFTAELIRNQYMSSDKTF